MVGESRRQSERAPAARTRVALLLVLAMTLTAGAALSYLASEPGGGAAWSGFPIDDAWIHQVYARSMARGMPFQYNPGEPETGATSPLWVLLLAPIHLLHLPVVVATKFLGVLLTAAAAVAGFGVAARIGERRAGWAFLLVMPLMPYLTFAAISGTEVPLFVFLLLVTGYLVLGRCWLGAGAAAGLAILSRPEGLVLLPLLAAAAGLARWRTVDSARRPLLAAIAAATRPLGPAVAVNLPWIAYCLWASGRPLPSTFYMKTAWLGAFNVEQLRRIGLFLVGQPFLGATVEGRLVVVLGAGVAAALLLLGAVRLQRASTSALLTIVVFPVLFLHGLSARLYFGAVKGPDQPGSIANFYYARYLLPAVPFLLMIWLIGLSRLDSRVQRRLALRLTVAIACLAIPAVSLVQQHVRLRSIFPRNCDDIERLDVEGGKWIATHLPPDASVGVSDAGALRYFGERRIVDLAGLNTHRLVPLLLELWDTDEGSAEEARIRAQFWRDEKLDYLAVFPRWHQGLLRGHRFEQIKVFHIENNSIAGGSTMVVALVRPVSR